MTDVDLEDRRDTLCRCETCGREEWVAFADCLRFWSPPHCHGQAMRLVQTRANVACDYVQAIDRLSHLAADGLRAQYAHPPAGGA
jgi:hypothetical protein